MTANVIPEQIDDAAINFTLSYLEIIERNLGVTYSSQGEPICIPGNITSEIVTNLAQELEDFLRNENAVSAIEACKIYGQEHIQSVGFGHVSDFDAFVKIGFLHSERVVIWDILSSRILNFGNENGISVDSIADIACNLLLLRPVVESGGIVVLPHPLQWSQKAREILSELRDDQDRSPTAIGLLFAMTAISEGLLLQPYTLATSKKLHVTPPSGGLALTGYSSAPQDFSDGMMALMSQNEFGFLRAIRVDDFYRIVNKYPELYRTLRKHFSSLSGLSPKEAQKEMEALSSDLKQLSAARDKAIANYWLDGSLATAGVITGGITMTASPAGATLLAILGLSPTALSAVRRVLARPSNDVIVQAFSELRSASPFTLELVTEIPDNEEAPDIHPDLDLAQHIDEIASAHWTEDAHRYLEELDEDLATAVLNSLGPEQIDQLVNYRHRQEDYIGDYLEFVWQLSQDAFWRHIEQIFMSDGGMLMYDGDEVHSVLISKDMPLPVWMKLLQSIPDVYSDPLKNGRPLRYKEVRGSDLAEQQIEELAEVVSYQLLQSATCSGKQAMFRLWLSELNADSRATVEILLRKAFPSGLPEWIA